MNTITEQAKAEAIARQRSKDAWEALSNLPLIVWKDGLGRAWEYGYHTNDGKVVRGYATLAQALNWYMITQMGIKVVPEERVSGRKYDDESSRGFD